MKTFRIWAQLLLLLSMLSLGAGVFAETAWIDVRSAPEHLLDNIEGDIRIPYDNIGPQVSRLFPDKDTEIHLYCYSGGRAEKALSALREAGYHNVTNDGGIDDARATRGLTD